MDGVEPVMAILRPLWLHGVLSHLPTLSSRRILVSFVAVLVAVSSDFTKADSDSPWIVGFDALDSIRPDTWGMSDIVKINRVPLFDNAPFLQLRHGDIIVSAKYIIPGSLQQGYYILSQGKYYKIIAHDAGGKLLLDEDWLIRDPLLFAWEFTLPRAKVLADLEKGSGQGMSLIQYASIYDSIRRRFPNKGCQSPGSIDIAEDRVLPIPGQNVAEFQGIAYDAAFNRLERYIQRIGPETCTMRIQVLIQGPPRVNRWEFDEEYVRKNNADPGANGTFFTNPDPATAKIKRAEFIEWLAFQTIVLDVISPNRVKSDEETALSDRPPDSAGKASTTRQ
jgi:hypothetical protein